MNIQAGHFLDSLETRTNLIIASQVKDSGSLDFLATVEILIRKLRLRAEQERDALAPQGLWASEIKATPAKA
jgi:hypothetical protein